MSRLSDSAYEIIAAEIGRLCQNPLEQVRADIVLRRLNRLRKLPGKPLTLDEMREVVSDIFPDFNKKVLQRAARINKAAVAKKKLGRIGSIFAGAVAIAAGIWVLNLPYPMIRWPVARTMPMLLLPSYISMDYHYRQAISLIEQADQLVNRATSSQDIELGAVQTIQAQQHLDNLPVWFLGYYPRAYCSLFSCSWRFTYDEFQNARKLIGRTEAVVFQEQNALTLLAAGAAEVDAAQQAYQSANSGDPQTQAVDDWRRGMDTLNEIPAQTLAGRMAQTKLAAYQRDYAQAIEKLSGKSKTEHLVNAAKSFAYQAALQTQNPPHPATTWQRAAKLWEQAIDQLERVPTEDPGYDAVQNRLAEYTKNLGIAQEWLQKEIASQKFLEQAQDASVRLVRQADKASSAQTASQLQEVINQLRMIPPGVTVYQEAQELLRHAERKLQQLTP